MTMNKTHQRDLIRGAVLEFLGILALAVRFGANRGGIALLLLGSAALIIGLAIQIRAIVKAR